MAHELLDFFPFDMRPGPEFLLVYLGLAAAVLFLGLRARTRLAPSWIDRPADDETPEPDSTPLLWAADGGPYRDTAAAHVTTAEPASQPLRRGVIPVGEQLYAVAELRAGRPAVANLIIAKAVGERWLAPTKKGRFRFDGDGKPATSLTRLLFDALRKEGLQMNAEVVKTAADDIAGDAGSDLRSELTAAGLVRSRQRQNQWILLGLVPTALVLAIGFGRIAWLAEINRPYTNLVLTMLLVGFVGLRFALHEREKSTSRSAYLEWLDDATISLRGDVSSGRRLDGSDVALALTAGGAAVLAGKAFDGVSSALVDDSSILYTTASTWGSGSSSTWSGCSSFGGGGGCGGGGCGGGGGCS